MRFSEVGRHWDKLATNAQDPALTEFCFIAFAKSHANRGENQESAENIENKVKAIDERNAEPDHDAAHDQRANNSPNEHAMVRDRRHFEIAEDEDEDKDVIDAQRVFDQIPREEIERPLSAL